jgi:hypothetical protein
MEDRLLLRDIFVDDLVTLTLLTHILPTGLTLKKVCFVHG